MRRCAAFLLALLLALAVWDVAGPGGEGAWAQVQSAAQPALDEDDYETWESIARRADDAISDGRASAAAFKVLRGDLVDWRIRFQREVSLHRSKVETLQSQIAALGAPPDEGQSEAELVAVRRTQLNQEFQSAVAPVRKAEESLARSEALVRDLDHLLRQRQQQKLLERGPSPLNPANVASALEDLRSITRVLLSETATAVALSSERTLFRQRLGAIAILLVLAGVLLWVGRVWIRRTGERLVHGTSVQGRRYIAAMVLSLGQVVLPGIGLILLTVALLLSSMFGARGEALLRDIPAMGLCFFTMRWLAGQTFPRSAEWPSTLDLSAQQNRRGRFYMWALGILVALALFVQSLDNLFVLDDGTMPVLAFPLICLTGICVAGLGRLLIANAKVTPDLGTPAADLADAPDERTLFDRVLVALGRIYLVFAIVGPFLAMIGYLRAGISMTLAPGLSLALLALVTFLQRLNVTVFRAFSKRGEEGGEGLWPVLINALIMIASLPLFGLIWGARVTDLQELWLTLREGVLIGGTRISPTVLLAFVLVFMFGYFLTRLFQGVLRASILPRTSLEPGAQSAITSGLGYVGLTIAAMVAVSVAGLDLSNLAIVAGALSVGLGFGLQNVVSNFVSGLILLAERPVSEGDWIEVAGIMGTVRKISVRATTVETFDRTDVIVPNSDLITSQVTNWTRGNLSGRLILPVGVAYGTDTRKVQTILQEIAEAHPLVIVNPPPHVVFQGFGESSLDFEIRVILRDINFGLGTRSELNHRIAERFTEEGIEIPFAQRDLWVRNPEALRPTPVPMPAGGIVSTARIVPDSIPELPGEDT